MDKSRVEHTILFIEKISFSLKLFSGHFYGQSFIKTVRGPYEISKIHSKQKRNAQVKVLHSDLRLIVHLDPVQFSIAINIK